MEVCCVPSAQLQLQVHGGGGGTGGGGVGGVAAPLGQYLVMLRQTTGLASLSASFTASPRP